MSSAAIAADGTIYFGAEFFYAIDPSGEEKWKFVKNGWFDMCSPAIGKDGTIYIGSREKNLYAMNPDGSIKWEFAAEGPIMSSPAIAEDGTIYVGSIDKKLYAINRDGSKKWEFTTGAEVVSSPALGKDGTIYVGSHDNNFYAIHRRCTHAGGNLAEGQLEGKSIVCPIHEAVFSIETGKLLPSEYFSPHLARVTKDNKAFTIVEKNGQLFIEL